MVNKGAVKVLIYQTVLKNAPHVKHISVNQTQTCTAVATTQGYEIIHNDNSEDFIKKKVVNLGESVELIEMMYNSNFIVLVLSSQRHKIVIWDDAACKNRTEIAFNTPVRNVKLRKEMMVVVLESKAFFFTFPSLKLMQQLDTGLNVLGLIGLSTAEKALSRTCVVPNFSRGSVNVITYGKSSETLIFQ